MRYTERARVHRGAPRHGRRRPRRCASLGPLCETVRGVGQRRGEEQPAERDAQKREAADGEGRSTEESADQVPQLRGDGPDGADLAPEIAGHGEPVDGAGDSSRGDHGCAGGEHDERERDRGRVCPGEQDGDGCPEAVGEHRPPGALRPHASRLTVADEVRDRDGRECDTGRSG